MIHQTFTESCASKGCFFPVLVGVGGCISILQIKYGADFFFKPINSHTLLEPTDLPREAVFFYLFKPNLSFKVTRRVPIAE